MVTRDSAHVLEEKYLVPLPGIEMRFPGCLARVLITVPTTDYHSRFDSKWKPPLTLRPHLPYLITLLRMRDWTQVQWRDATLFF